MRSRSAARSTTSRCRPAPGWPSRARSGPSSARPVSTQETFGRLLTGPRRPRRRWRPGWSPPRPTSACPRTSAAGSTRWACSPRRSSADFLGTERLLRWRQGPAGHHIELGHQRDEPVPHARPARPGPRAARRAPAARSAPSTTRSSAAASTRSSTRSTTVPASWSSARRPGITLAPEGGAHQSHDHRVDRPGAARRDVAPSRPTPWRSTGCCATGCDRLADPDGDALYLRLSTRPLDQAPFAAARARLGDERLRADVLAGGYRLVDPAPRHRRAGGAGRQRGGACPRWWPRRPSWPTRACAATVLDLTSPDRLYRQWRMAPARTRPATAVAARPRRRCTSPGSLPAGRAARADRHRPRRGQPRPGLAGLGVRRAGRCPSASTPSASRARIDELLRACSTSCRSRSSTPRSSPSGDGGRAAARR